MFQNNKDEEKIFKAFREKENITLEGLGIRIS